MKRPFSESDITVTMTGSEWVTVLARMLRRELSKEGEKTYHRASTKLQKQLLAAQSAHGKEEKPWHPPVTMIAICEDE